LAVFSDLIGLDPGVSKAVKEGEKRWFGAYLGAMQRAFQPFLGGFDICSTCIPPSAAVV